MAEDTVRKAPRTEEYQAQQKGFWNGKFYEKGNIRTFNEGEDVPFYFQTMAEVTKEHEAKQKAPDRPTLEDVGISKAKPTNTIPTESDNKGRMSAEEAGMPKAKPTPVTTSTGTDAPTTEVQAEPEEKPEKKKVKKKATKKKAKKKTVKKKAKKK